MKRSTLAIVAALAGSLFAAAASAETTSGSLLASDQAPANNEYYSAADQAVPPPPSPPATAAATDAPAAAMPATAASGGASSCSDCAGGSGCATCCDGCCGEKLPHWLHCDCKLHPLFCWYDDCPLNCPDMTPCRLFNDCCLKANDITATGWIDGGIMGNSFGPTNHFNGPVTYTDRDDGQLNQFYGSIQRTPADINKNCGWFIGGDIDFYFGSDYFFTTAAGLDGTKRGNSARWYSDPNRLYGYSMPQAYVETDFDDLRVKWGHFYTTIGYEVAPSIGNFFYSHSYAMQYGEPVTHTGALASRNINDNWSWTAGVVAGWNDFDFEDGAQFLGGITYTDKVYGSLAFSIVSGNESDFNVPGVGPVSNRTMYSLVWTRNLTSRWTYVMQHDLGVQQDTLGFNALDAKRAEWYGINQYLFYKINCCWTAGWRFEWFDDPQGYLVTGLRPDNTDARFRFPGSFYETSVGLNYKPNGNLTVRTELRYDWYDGQPGFSSPLVQAPPPNQPYGDSMNKNQFLLGVDVVYQF